MTPILFLVGFGLGLILAFARHPIYALYTYLFAFYMAPAHTWWRNDVPDIRYLFVAGIIAVIASFNLPRDSRRESWFKTAPGRLILLFVIYNWLQIFWAVDRDAQIEGASLYTKHLITFYLMYRFADSIERIKEIALIHVIGCAWFGYQALDASGGRLESIGGAVSGANELGVHVSTGLLFGGILLLELRGARRWAAFACMPLIANCLVLTVSRGAFLGFFAGGLGGYFAVSKQMAKRYALCGVLGVAMIALLAHDALIERFTETYLALTTDAELDSSAQSRMDITRAGIAIGLEYPFGAGNAATERLSGAYMEPEFLGDEPQGRAAHNTMAGVFAEHGFPGALLYLLMILWTLKTTMRMRRLDSSMGGKVGTLGMMATLAGTSLIAIYVSGNFSSNINIETQYWCLALLASADQLYRSIAHERPAADGRRTGKIGWRSSVPAAAHARVSRKASG